MKKLTCFIIAWGITTSIGFAQIIINSGFETWNVTPQGWEDPDNWTSSNSTVLGGDAFVNKTSDSYAGSYAAEISTVGLGNTGLPYAGILVNGTFDFGVITPIDDLIAAGTPISFVPTELHGFYKYSQLNTGDSAYVRIIVKKYNLLTNQRDTVAWAEARLPAESSYTAFSIGIDKLLPGVAPDSIVIMFFSKHPDEQLAGGVLIVDEISLVDPSGTSDPNSVSAAMAIFPNPSNGLITLSGMSQENVEVSVYNILGELILHVQLNESGETKMDLSSFPDGVYLVQLHSENTLFTQRIVKG